jgi:hypothetical protein
MAYPNRSCFVLTALATLLLTSTGSYGQDGRQDHSCTLDVAGATVSPQGQDGHNFDRGWGIQAGGGFLWPGMLAPKRGLSFYLTGNYMYAQLSATAKALAAAQLANPMQLSSATSAHGSFSAATFDPTVRYAFNREFGLYGAGGFGWFHRGVSFHGANPATLLQSSGSSLDRLASDSGVFDIGGGANFGLKKNGGLMIFTEIRLYKGAAINSGTKLVPLSAGVRW